MKPFLSAMAAAVLVSTAAAPSARAQGTVDVSFVHPEKFRDIGLAPSDREHVLDVLRRHFESLGAKLPEGQRLVVEVLDVDLAGELKNAPRSPTGQVRILSGRGDWPHMTLKFTLASGGQTVKSGKSELSDMSYMTGSVRSSPTGAGELLYETRMVDRWFEQNFVPKKSKKK